MSFQGHQTTMTTKEMSKSFLPIILFSIVLPFIDIITDLRMIIRLYSGITGCIPLNVSHAEFVDCRNTADLSTFCQQNPNACKLEDHPEFATILLGELTS